MSTLMVLAGGTGGHVYPALATAERLRAAGVQVVWLGTRRGLEAAAVPAAGFPIDWVKVRGFRRGWLDRVARPWRVLVAMASALQAILRRRPDALLGMGGFVAGPAGLVARLLGKPLVIHEQNAVVGLTNRWLARLTPWVCTGFPVTAGLERSGVEYVGNPVREQFALLPPPRERRTGARGSLRLLVVGGSQGAQVFNEVVPQALAALPAAHRPLCRHQCGRGRRTDTLAAYRAGPGLEGIVVQEFLDPMAPHYAWADLVLCRAGAMAVAELAAAGVAALLVPFPLATHAHQQANARWLVQAGAARLLPQSHFDARRLAAELARFNDDRAGVLALAERARALAVIDADLQLARRCMEAMRA